MTEPISQELVKITKDLGGLIKQEISFEKELPVASFSVKIDSSNQAHSGFVCCLCGVQKWGFFKTEAYVYRRLKFCHSCHSNYLEKCKLIGDEWDWGYLVSRNNEKFQAYQKEVDQQLVAVQSRLTEAVTNLKNYEKELEDNKEELAKKEQRLEGENKDLISARDTALAKKEKAEKDLADANSELTKINSDLDKAKLDFSEANKLIEELNKKNKTRDKNLQDEIEKAVRATLARERSRNGNNGEPTAGLSEAETKIIALELQIKTMMENHETEIQHLNLQIANLNNQIGTLTHQLQTANNLLANSQQLVQQQNQRITQLEATIAQGIQMLKDKEQALEKSSNRNKDLIKENDAYSAKNAGLALVIIDKDKEIEKRDKEIKAKDEQINTLTTERDNLKKLETENNQLKEDLKQEARQRKIALMLGLAQGVTDYLPIPEKWKTAMKTSIQAGSTYALAKKLPSWSYEFLFAFIGIGLFLIIPRLFRKLFGWFGGKKKGEVSVVINNVKPTDPPKLAKQ